MVVGHIARWLRDEEATPVIANRTERIMGRALRVPQRVANDGRERAVTVTRDPEQIQRWETFSLVTGPQTPS